MLSAYGPSLLFGLGEGAVLPVIPLTAHDLGGSIAVASLVAVVINIGSFVFNIPASIITHRYGERMAIIGAAVTGFVASLLWLFAQSLWPIMVGALLLGMSGAVFMLARQKYLTEAVPVGYRARALSILSGVMRIGIFLGPFVGAAVISLWGARAAYVVCAVALAIAGLLAARLADLRSPAEDPKTGSPGIYATLREHRHTFLTVGVAILLVGAVREARQVVIPLWAQHIGLSHEGASIVYGIANSIDMLAFYPAGRVMDLRGRRWVSVPAMSVMGVALLAIPLTHSVIPFALVCCLLGLGNGLGAGMVMTLGADFSPDVGRAQFLGVWRQMSDIGGTGGPALLSAVTAAVALGPGIVLCGTLGVIAAAVLWRTVPSGVPVHERGS